MKSSGHFDLVLQNQQQWKAPPPRQPRAQTESGFAYLSHLLHQNKIGSRKVCNPHQTSSEWDCIHSRRHISYTADSDLREYVPSRLLPTDRK